ncbi:hypothetical protein SAY87_000184 [Trapa incisa]|uniref:Uncharacterized protein n=1 Tax=Trapa incisa TaxID=236973 RepID=A0AAN7GE61_9MYRT|nr:hypothetical protein SAY87_000184 [Trapa incisa]
MLYALRYEKESPVQLMQLFNKLAAQSPKYKPGGRECVYSTSAAFVPNYGEHYKGWLRDVDYPFVGNRFQKGRHGYEGT